MSSTNIYLFQNQIQFDSFNRSMAIAFDLDYIQEQFIKEDYKMDASSHSPEMSPMYGLKHSTETKRKMSEAAKNRSQDYKDKMSQLHKGKTVSKETCLKISQSKLGKKRQPHSEETKRKMREAKANISIQTRKNISESAKNRKMPSMTEEHKRKIAESVKRTKLKNKEINMSNQILR